jgi:hypothetical protein
MDNRFSITSEALESFRANLARVKQPGQGVKGSKLAPQELCGMVDADNGSTFSGCELISFNLSSVATNRLQTVGNGIKIPNPESMEQRGAAVMLIGGRVFADVPLHLTVALAFALRPKIDLSATIGKISSQGNKNGKFWLSLSMEADLTTEEKIQALSALYGSEQEQPKEEQKEQAKIEDATFENVPEQEQQPKEEQPTVNIG